MEYLDLRIFGSGFGFAGLVLVPLVSAAVRISTMTDLNGAMENFASTKEWTPALDEALGEVSKTGASSFAWEQLKEVLSAKLEVVGTEDHSTTKDLSEPFDEVVKRMQSLLAEFPNAPFTVQRLCSAPS